MNNSDDEQEIKDVEESIQYHKEQVAWYEKGLADEKQQLLKVEAHLQELKKIMEKQ